MVRICLQCSRPGFEMPGLSLGWEYPLKKRMTTLESLLVAQMVKNLPAMHFSFCFSKTGWIDANAIHKT